MKYIVEFEDEPCMYEDEVHFYKCIQAPWWGLSERVIKQLTPYQPDAPDTNVGNITNLCAHENDPISRQERILADIRETKGDDSVCGMCEYDGAYIGQSGDWCNECPGFDKDDCFKLSDECRKRWMGDIALPSAQPNHIAESGRKVSISCAHENDVIFRKVAIDALARMMPHSYTPDGSHPADEEIFRVQEVFADCIEALEILPSAQPDNQTNLCDSCDYSYPDCPSKYDDVIFGNGIGNDNICACNKYKPSAQPERKKGEWIKISPANIYECSKCGKNVMTDDISEYDFCHGCGADMRGTEND